MNIDKLENELDNSNTISKLSNSFNNITRALNKACNGLYKDLFDYNFSKYLYCEYILKNRTKREIAKDLQISSSNVYYYIKKYNLKKDMKDINSKRLESIQKTCQDKYGVDHPGQLDSTHVKRITNIVIKTQGCYDKTNYPKLAKTPETISRMKEAQQLRRLLEREEKNGETKKD